MKSGLQVAGAIGVGYLLGRTRKLRLALALGTAAATGQLGRAPGDLVQRGTKALAPGGLGPVAEPGQRLLEAGKAAALAALTSRIDQVSDRLKDRAEGLRVPSAPSAPDVAGKAPTGLAEKVKPGATEQPEQEEPEGAAEEEPEATADEEEPEGAAEEEEPEAAAEEEPEAAEEEPEAAEEAKPKAAAARPKTEQPRAAQKAKGAKKAESTDRAQQPAAAESGGSREKVAAGSPVRRKRG